ncbi:MAG: hypothetical protein JSS05_13390 [Proteobacteria bacterium]|nr:hypothetical protein [Pseudomonadota bacterium]
MARRAASARAAFRFAMVTVACPFHICAAVPTAYSGPPRPKSHTQDGDGDYWAHRSRREKIEADRAALALAKDRGELINKEGALRSFETATRLLRDAVLGVPDRLPFPREQQIQVRDALAAALTDVAKALTDVGG